MASSRNKSAKLGEFVKAVDFVLRNEYDYKYKLTVIEASKQDQIIIKNAVAECRNEQKKAEAMKIEIDIFQLVIAKRN